jgi:large subunit ribosomal protein L2
MALKKFRPTSPGVRHAILIDRRHLSNVKPHRALVTSFKKAGGRNNTGQITMRHQGGGAKQLYRFIDFARSKHGVKGEVETVEYDPNRTAFIALIKYADGDRRYILAPDGLKVGDNVMSGPDASIAIGNALPLSKIPQGTFVHAVELYPNKGATIARGAGTVIQVMGGDKGYVQLKMPSGELRLVKETCYATIGTVSNPDQKNVKFGKAGRKRLKGIRPTVRGVAMSTKHPHAGGQGKGGRHGTGGPKSDRWGNKIGTRTRRGKSSTNKYIVRRRPETNKFKKTKSLL